MSASGPHDGTAFDVAIIGAGMAGASLAAEVAEHARVLILEAETAPGYHATGRSAAFWLESYGGPMVAPLTLASRETLAAAGVLRPRGCLHLAAPGDEDRLEALQATMAPQGTSLTRQDRKSIEALVPGVLRGFDHALLEPGCADIDVAALHALALAAARRSGAVLACCAGVQALLREGGRWSIETAAGRFRADVIVDAAGAWADRIARIAGVQEIGLVPLRRTMVQLRVAPAVAPAMPLVVDAAGGFYMKPEAGGRLWVTPHDETPTAPGDVAPEEEDVARGIARLEATVDWRVEAVERRWAGLRTFAPDRLPVYGCDADVPGFFWCAGQGGFGIQTAPAAARLAASLLLGSAPHPSVREIDPARFSPDRFGHSGRA